jgi:exonuclease SbcD
MRVVHTADWHVGRLWKNLQRLDETARVLDHLARFVERERIDLLLVAGDIFDTPNPGAEAERLVYEFFRRLGAAGVPAVVIAGDHDSAGRMEAWGTLADLAGVRVVGRPRAATRGGVQEVRTRGGETALVAALPFAGPAVLVSGLELAGEETAAKSLYADRFKQAVRHLVGGLRAGCVNRWTCTATTTGARTSARPRRASRRLSSNCTRSAPLSEENDPCVPCA